jgi:two-component system, cell cycle sensor histidine kinase and response regulator CckA
MSTAQILVVEDERIVARALQCELENFGYQVSGIASSAQEAVQKAVDDRPDLVLMDIHLKGEEDGIEAARKIHSRCRIPVVYLSAFSDAATVARASDTEAFGYLLKPYEERELQTTIEMTLAKHRAEQRLEESERWLAAIHNGIDDAVIATDPENCVHSMNFAGEALTGWSMETAIGAPVSVVCQLVDERGHVVHDDFADRVVCESRALELPADTRLITADGRDVPVEGSISPIYDSRGEFLGTVLALRDISTRLELERLTRQSEERRRRAQKTAAVSRLADGLSRRLSEMLTTILGNTSLALAGFTAEAECLKLLTDVEIAAQRASALVQRLRMFARFSGGASSQLQAVNLNTLVPACLNQIKPLLNSRTKLSYKPTASVRSVIADELLLGQALVELALNAQDAMPLGGQLTLEMEDVALTFDDLAQHPDGRTGDFVRLRVTDTGRGIPSEIRARMFEPFSTAEPSAETAGLGLPLVSAVIEQHNGWIECASQLDQGSRFDLFLPAV